MRERILDEASALIADQGLAATTVDQIAERVDISQTTFFNYFATKSVLVDALVGRLVDQWNDVVEKAHAADTPVTDKVGTLFRLTADLTHGQHRLLRDLIVETTRSSRDTPSGVSRMRSFFRDDLAEGQARGEVRTDQDPATLADCVLGLYVSVLLFWTTDTEYPIADRLHEAAQMATEMIRSSPGG